MSGPSDQGSLIRAARLWAKTSAKGQPYMVGRMGGLRVLVMPNRDKQTDKDPTHWLLVGPTPERQDDGSNA